MRLSERLLALADGFVPSSEEDVDRLRRIRVGIVVGWMGILFSGLSVVLYAAYGSPISAAAICAIVAGLALTAPAIRRGVPIETVAHAVIGVTWAVTFIVAWRTGGFFSPAVVWAFFHPITSYIACGKRSAIVWSLLSGAQITILYGLHRAGVDFAHDISADAAESVRFGGFLVVIVANMMVIGGNEAIRRASEEAKVRANRALERQRILGDMHDGVGSQLLGLIIQLRGRRIDDERLLQGLESCLDDLRLIVDSLDPLDRPFDVSLAELRGRMESRCAAAGIELEWSLGDAPAPLPVGPEQGLQVLRALQEMFANALRHSGTERIDFELRGPSGPDRVIEVRVRDYGRGFDPAAVRSGGRGLTSLRTRTHRLGGELVVEPAAPGTVVALRFAASPA